MKPNSVLKVLLVEDNAADTELIEELLESIGNTQFELKTVKRLEEGLKSLEEADFDVILSDLSVPDSFGLDTVKRIKARSPKVPLVVLTALNDESIALEAVSFGAQDYLVKRKLERELLVRAIHYAIARQRSEEALRLQAERERLLERTIERIRASLDLEDILQTTVNEVRQFLQIDRVVIYRCQPSVSQTLNEPGYLVVEAVGAENYPNWNQSIYSTLAAACLLPDNSQQIRAVADVNQALVTPHCIEILVDSKSAALLTLPIFQARSWSIGRGEFQKSIDNESESPAGQIWGLVMAHHYSGQREWQQWEIDFLTHLANQVAIAIQQSELYQQLALANQKLQQLATTDYLTGVANRRRFDEFLDLEWQRGARELLPLSIILCDIDFFKLYNDTYGHLAGDTCLQQIVRAIASATKRPTDLVARYGGEEFAIVLPNTDTNGALTVAKKIHRQVEILKLPHTKSPVSQFVTLSLGIATTTPSHHQPPTVLVKAADEALYKAKALGRNCIFPGGGDRQIAARFSCDRREVLSFSE